MASKKEGEVAERGQCCSEKVKTRDHRYSQVIHNGDSHKIVIIKE
jgi:hypothetical protein